MKAKTFPNGIDSYLETHFEVTCKIAAELLKDEFDSSVIKDRHEAQGTGGMYELAEELTDEFEKLHENTVWEGDWLDTIDAFLIEKLHVQ